jgi:hypothetical protein
VDSTAREATLDEDPLGKGMQMMSGLILQGLGIACSSLLRPHSFVSIDPRCIWTVHSAGMPPTSYSFG